MKATLEFNLEDPFDAKAHLRAVKATDAYLCLLAIQDHLHQLQNIPPDSYDYRASDYEIGSIVTTVDRILEKYGADVDRELE